MSEELNQNQVESEAGIGVDDSDVVDAGNEGSAVVEDIEGAEAVEAVSEGESVSEGVDSNVSEASMIADGTASEETSEAANSSASDGDSLGKDPGLAEGKGISDVELDEIADTALSILRSILKFFDVGEVTIDEYEGEEGELIFDITGGDLAVLIGRHGSTLSALQSLVSTITTKKIGYRYPVQIDIEGYRGRQRQKIEAVARSSANRAVQQGRSIKLRPMSPYERRIVHLALRDDSRVGTASEGEGGARYVVVSPS